MWKGEIGYIKTGGYSQGSTRTISRSKANVNGPMAMNTEGTHHLILALTLSTIGSGKMASTMDTGSSSTLENLINSMPLLRLFGKFIIR